MDTPIIAACLQRLLPCFNADILPEAWHVLANMVDCVMPFLTAPVG